jgi:hypothetical protein
MRDVPNKSFRENQNTHAMFNASFFPKIVPFMRCGKILYSRTSHRLQRGACAVHAGYLRLQTQSDYIICIAFPLQQWLQLRVSVLRDTYIVGPAKFSQRCGLHSSGMTPRHWVVGSRCFETMYWSHLQWSKCQKRTLHP